MHIKVKKIIQDIKKLKIQGARNVARAALQALGYQIHTSKAKTIKALYKELLITAAALAQSRPTEPMMRNVIEDVTRHALLTIKKQARSVKQAKKLILRREESVLKEMEKSIDRVAQHGAALIPKNAFIVTHCHSSSVTAILKRAKKQGKKLEVAVCETRPRYQGRITAQELARAKIKVSLFVDGAMNLLMRDAHLVLVGADSISSRGDLINKVGTATLAHIARLHDVSFYSAAELYKYSPLTLFGQRERIEERDSKEVWDRSAHGVNIRNPAFDVTAARYINGYITDVGVIPPQSLFAIAAQRLKIRI